MPFAVFMATYILVMIPFSMYWSYLSVFLSDKGFKFITIPMSLGQVSEMGFMLLVPVVLARLGVKWAMVFGLAAMLIQRALLTVGAMYNTESLYYVAIAMHGLIFGLYFVGGQIYVDRKAPKEMRAQAQGFLFLVGFGFGQIIGNFVDGEIVRVNTPAAEEGVKAIPDWTTVWMITAVLSAILLAVFIALFRDRTSAVGSES
jgi:MFS family permease